MFVFNVKINKGRLFKIICIIIIILVVLTLFLSMSKIAKKIKSNSINANSILEIKSNDYTNFLKDCHDNIDKYVGKRVKISGYIYRMPDFSDNEIVIARTCKIAQLLLLVYLPIMTMLKNWMTTSG